MRVAADVSPLELADYQRAVRLLLRHPLITPSYPDKGALPLVRRWTTQLRADLSEVLGYRLLTTADTARLLRVHDRLDATTPALTRTDRPFNRRRYAYLMLTLAALGRSGTQISLSELADAVSADAARIDGLGMDTERKPDRDAFVDAVAWLERRGALALADGSASAWVNDPDRAEALYDIDREIVGAVYRPSRVLQHVRSVTALLDTALFTTGQGLSQGQATMRRAAARKARRLVLEQPVVYYAEVDETLHGQLRSPNLAEDLERLTGLTVERRAEGVAVIDTSGRLSDVRFPGGGTIAQAALLLAARIATYCGPGNRRNAPALLPAPTAAERLAETAGRIDSALPHGNVLAELAGPDRAETAQAGDAVYPFLPDTWSRRVMRELVGQYGAAFGAVWRADPDRLLGEAVALLAKLRLVAVVEGGLLALPLLARYRGVTAEVKRRPDQTTLFEDVK
ncbi:TIGR02678 family protein [Nonomuraea sp. K274]|uniref:TIGR02678 family protein n=1 Tax=Nonomuraea cypriaca TaxID=1187855 RepID=A0A931AMG8_9ACTN|nr:TIGR02678 family protein [Nonomuraea cypriaca]MBF8192925.1 TIGR02678 family protein [Nonomuraea cypriaca]